MRMATTQTKRLLLFLPFFLTTLLIYCQAISTVDAQHSPFTQSNGTDYIRSSCDGTLYPEICYTSLSPYASAVQQSPGRLARVAIGVSLSRARHMAAYISNLTRQADFGADHRATASLHDCFSTFGDAVDNMRDSLKTMRRVGAADSSSASFRFQMSDVQTWMSAALTNEDTCADGFEDVADGPMKTDVCNRVADARKFISNALHLVNNYAETGIP